LVFVGKSQGLLIFLSLQNYINSSNESGRVQSDALKKLYQLDNANNQFDEGAANEMSEKAKALTGITKEPREAGFVLRDGTMLDLSGRYYATGYVRSGESFVPEAGKEDYLKNQK
jgi:hypothetical protein